MARVTDIMLCQLLRWHVGECKVAEVAVRGECGVILELLACGGNVKVKSCGTDVKNFTIRFGEGEISWKKAKIRKKVEGNEGGQAA
jgi:hypothetical protein